MSIIVKEEEQKFKKILKDFPQIKEWWNLYKTEDQKYVITILSKKSAENNIILIFDNVGDVINASYMLALNMELAIRKEENVDFTSISNQREEVICPKNDNKYIFEKYSVIPGIKGMIELVLKSNLKKQIIYEFCQNRTKDLKQVVNPEDVYAKWTVMSNFNDIQSIETLYKVVMGMKNIPLEEKNMFEEFYREYSKSKNFIKSGKISKLNEINIIGEPLKEKKKIVEEIEKELFKENKNQTIDLSYVNFSPGMHDLLLKNIYNVLPQIYLDEKNILELYKLEKYSKKINTFLRGEKAISFDKVQQVVQEILKTVSYRIHAPKGTKMIPIELLITNITNEEKIGNENEILLYPFEYKVIQKQSNNNGVTYLEIEIQKEIDLCDILIKRLDNLVQLNSDNIILDSEKNIPIEFIYDKTQIKIQDIFHNLGKEKIKYLIKKDREICEDELQYESQLYGKSHTRRVAFFTLAIANELNLTNKEIEILMTVTQNYNIGRTHDLEDEMLGTRSMEIIQSKARERLKKFSHDEIELIEFIITQHSKNTKENNIAIEKLPKEKQEKYRLMLNCLEDADKLDRAREHSLNTDRLAIKEISKKFATAAYQACESYEQIIESIEQRERNNELIKNIRAEVIRQRNFKFNNEIEKRKNEDVEEWKDMLNKCYTFVDFKSENDKKIFIILRKSIEKYFKKISKKKKSEKNNNIFRR